MTGSKYQMNALRTAPERNFAEDMAYLTLGLNGEAGECADVVKKWLYHGHDLDMGHLARELGDVLWYVAVMAHRIGYTLDEIMQMNVDKLKERYPNGFEVERSKNRKMGDL